jgi:hypothetical protein
MRHGNLLFFRLQFFTRDQFQIDMRKVFADGERAATPTLRVAALPAAAVHWHGGRFPAHAKDISRFHTT